MKRDIYGQLIFTETDICETFLKNPSINLKNTLVDKMVKFPDFLEIKNKPKLKQYIATDLSIEEFDLNNQSDWFMPIEYKTFDIAKYVLDLCSNDAELQRTGEELLLYQERDMFPLLRYLKYLVDTMKENNIVWGVGRGSSVASFVLFLIGIHRINSLYWDLPIEEFLK